MEDIRDTYERFKTAGIVSQALRLSNAMFAVFAFWNFALEPDPALGLAPIAHSRPFFLAACLAAGLPFGLLSAIKLSNRTHLLLVAPLAGAFFVSSAKDPVGQLFLIPMLSAAVLLIVRFIITVSNSSIQR